MATIDTAAAHSTHRRLRAPRPRRPVEPKASDAGGPLRHRHHPHCIACDPRRRHGLRLHFAPGDDGWLEGTVTVGRQWEGYSGVCHGGIVATILDSAMTNCLFARGIAAVTAALEVRYQQPVPAQRPLRIRARILREHDRLYKLEADLLSDANVLARGVGRFIPLGNGGAASGRQTS